MTTVLEVVPDPLALHDAHVKLAWAAGKLRLSDGRYLGLTPEWLANLARHEAREKEIAGRITEHRQAKFEDYVFDGSQDAYWDLNTGLMVSARVVDGRIPKERHRSIPVPAPEPAPGDPPRKGRPPAPKDIIVPPSVDLRDGAFGRHVDTTVWWPGRPQIIRGYEVVTSEGLVNAPHKTAMLNLYRPPPLVPANPDQDAVAPYLDHLRALWPQDYEHLLDVAAHMVQRPEEKCNWGLVLAGEQGIGKDVALMPVIAAVGAGNYKNISLKSLFGDFNPYIQTVMLVIDEGNDEHHASVVYELLKTLTTAPPDVLALNPKYGKMRYVRNLLRVFITTNNLHELYIPPGDRRLCVLRSPKPKGWQNREYFDRLCGWFDGGGNEAVAAYLMARDLSAFNPKGHAPETAGSQSVKMACDEPDDGITFALERLSTGEPPALPSVIFPIELLLDGEQFDHREQVEALLNAKSKELVHRMARAGYVPGPRPSNKEGRWGFKVRTAEFRSRMVYVQQNFEGDPIAAITERGMALATKKLKSGESQPALRQVVP